MYEYVQGEVSCDSSRRSDAMRIASMSSMFAPAILAQATSSVRATSRGAWSAHAGQSKEPPMYGISLLLNVALQWKLLY